MMEELYIDYAIRLLEAAKRNKKRKSKSRKNLIEFFGAPEIDWEGRFGMSAEKLSSTFAKTISKFVGPKGEDTTKQIYNEVVKYLSINKKEKDRELKQYIILKQLSKGLNKLEKEYEKCAAFIDKKMQDEIEELYGVKKKNTKSYWYFIENKNKEKGITTPPKDQDIPIDKIAQKKERCKRIFALYKLLKKKIPQFGKLKSMWFWYRTQPLVVRIILFILGILIIGAILYLLFKGARKVIEIIRDFLNRGKTSTIEKAVDAASGEELVAAYSAGAVALNAAS